MFWTPRPFSSLIYFLNAQCGKAIQQTAQLYVGLCIVSLFLSMSNSVALIAGRVSGNNQWIQSQNKSANVVPSSWVNKQFPNKILSTALHVCVNTVLPLWWSGQRHASYTEEVIRFLQLYAEDGSFLQNIPLRASCEPQELHFVAWLETKNQKERKSWWAYLRVNKRHETKAAFASAVAIS